LIAPSTTRLMLRPFYALQVGGTETAATQAAPPLTQTRAPMTTTLAGEVVVEAALQLVAEGPVREAVGGEVPTERAPLAAQAQGHGGRPRQQPVHQHERRLRSVLETPPMTRRTTLVSLSLKRGPSLPLTYSLADG
jgi:hypothetical protein